MLAEESKAASALPGSRVAARSYPRPGVDAGSAEQHAVTKERGWHGRPHPVVAI